MRQYSLRLVLSITGLAFAFICNAEEVTDSVDTFNNQTVSTVVSVQGRTVLTSQNVTVSSTGQLTLNGPQGVLIPHDFVVNPGGSLILNGGLQYAVIFTYDESGNRIRREKEN